MHRPPGAHWPLRQEGPGQRGSRPARRGASRGSCRSCEGGRAPALQPPAGLPTPGRHRDQHAGMLLGVVPSKGAPRGEVGRRRCRPHADIPKTARPPRCTGEGGGHPALTPAHGSGRPRPVAPERARLCVCLGDAGLGGLLVSPRHSPHLGGKGGAAQEAVRAPSRT